MKTSLLILFATLIVGGICLGINPLKAVCGFSMLAAALWLIAALTHPL